LRLFTDITQRPIPRKTVFKVATDGAGLDCARDTLRDLAGVSP
jgi:hypothetical protein